MHEKSQKVECRENEKFYCLPLVEVIKFISLYSIIKKNKRTILITDQLIDFGSLKYGWLIKWEYEKWLERIERQQKTISVGFLL